MNFEAYCISKKIDPSAFKKADGGLYAQLEQVFALVSADSFTSQKKFLINKIRRAYTHKDLQEQSSTLRSLSTKPAMKPLLKPAPQTGESMVNSQVSKPTISPAKATSPSVVPKPKIPSVKKEIEISEEKTISKPATLKPKIPGKKE